MGVFDTGWAWLERHEKDSWRVQIVNSGEMWTYDFDYSRSLVDDVWQRVGSSPTTSKRVCLFNLGNTLRRRYDGAAVLQRAAERYDGRE